MQQPSSAAESPDPAPDPMQDLARDWATLWQSELAAVAADPETLLVLQSLAGAWLQAAAVFDAAQCAAQCAAQGAARGAAQDAAPDAAGPDAAPRAAAAGPAAGARDPAADDLTGLRRRLAELERRLAGNAAGDGGPGARG